MDDGKMMNQHPGRAVVLQTSRCFDGGLTR